MVLYCYNGNGKVMAKFGLTLNSNIPAIKNRIANSPKFNKLSCFEIMYNETLKKNIVK